MQNFTEMSADEAIAAVQSQSRAQRDKTVRRLLYKKGNRPADRADQLRLLESFANDDGLAPFERTYALVAASHKASELLDTDTLARFIPRLDTCYDWARTLPMRKELRKDGLHLRFSLLNVLVNASLLLDLAQRDRYAATALSAMADINPRKTTHYTFNSTTNILNTVGVALLIRPQAFAENIDIIRGLLFHSLRMKFARDLPAVLLRIGIPATLAEVDPPSNFLKFEESFRKFLAIKRAADATTDVDRAECYRIIAEECVSQSTPAQRAAHLDAVNRLLAPGWNAPPAATG